MEFTLTPISKLNLSGLARLTALHCAVMHGLLTDLGRPVVRQYYTSAQTDASVLGLCALSPDGSMLGWAMGSPDPAALIARLHQPPVWFARQMGRLALTRPGVFLVLLRSIFSASPANRLLGGQVELTYIGVSPEVRGLGLGTTLLERFIAQARLAGYASVMLSVETDNASAVALYTNSGFRITQTFAEGPYNRHRMEYRLT